MLHLKDLTLKEPSVGIEHADLIGIIDGDIELGILLRPAQMQYLSGEGKGLDDIQCLGIEDLDGREVLAAEGDGKVLLVRAERGEDR